MSGLTDYQKYVADMTASTYFKDWRRKNPKEYATWVAYDKAVQDGSQPNAPTLVTKFGSGMIDAGVMYLNAWDSPDAPTPVPPPVTEPPPVITPPPVVTPPPSGGGSPFQQLWDATQPPQKSWNQAKVISSQSAFDSWLGSRQANDHVVVKGFTYNGRCEIRGGGPFWIESDPTFQIVNSTRGSSGLGLWLVSCNGAQITGYPAAHDCGNVGVQVEASVNCYLEVDARDNGGTGAMLKPIGNVGTKPHGTFKFKGGNNGRGCMPPGSPGYEAAFWSDDLDPHAQKGTGAHNMNSWMVDAGSVILCDIIKEQKFGAGLESTAYAGTSAKPVVIGVRATNLSCDVDALPAGSGGVRQTGGNAWQPWGDNHNYCQIKAIECGKASTGVYGNGIGPGCVVAYGRVQSARESPCWNAPGVTFQDVQPKP